MTAGKTLAPAETLDLEISRSSDGAGEVRLLDSPVGRPHERLRTTPRELAELRDRIDRYDSLLLTNSGAGRAEVRLLAAEIGETLFRMVTPGEVGVALRAALVALDVRARESRAGLRLRFGFGRRDRYDPALATLPWELIRDPEAGGRFLASEGPTQVARYLDLSRPAELRPVSPPLRILAVLSSPRDQPEIDLAAQSEGLLAVARHRPGRLSTVFLERPTLYATRRKLRVAGGGSPFHVLHFLGHGAFAESGGGALYFEDAGGGEKVVPAEVLARHLAGIPGLRLVVLATCAGARMPRSAGYSPFTGSASALVAAGVPAVVAMQFSVSEQAAAAFTAAFYRELADAGCLEQAMAEGRLAILDDDPESCEWATPVLFLRAAGERLVEDSNPRVDEPESAGTEPGGRRGAATAAQEETRARSGRSTGRDRAAPGGRSRASAGAPAMKATTGGKGVIVQGAGRDVFVHEAQEIPPEVVDSGRTMARAMKWLAIVVIAAVLVLAWRGASRSLVRPAPSVPDHWEQAPVRVVDGSTGDPISGAVVKLDLGKVRWRVQTNREGNALLPVPPPGGGADRRLGEHWGGTVEASGYLRGELPIGVFGTEERDRWEAAVVSLTRRGTLRLVVRRRGQTKCSELCESVRKKVAGFLDREIDLMTKGPTEWEAIVVLVSVTESPPHCAIESELRINGRSHWLPGRSSTGGGCERVTREVASAAAAMIEVVVLGR